MTESLGKATAAQYRRTPANWILNQTTMRLYGTTSLCLPSSEYITCTLNCVSVIIVSTRIR
jgi:hypothetical protein